MRLDINQHAFFALLKAGLWGNLKVNAEGLQVDGLSLTSSASIDWQEVSRLAEEQSVVGLVAAGLDNYPEIKAPKEDVLQFVGQALKLEQSNQAMNIFVASLINNLRKHDVYAILVKGQGIAQCYEKPLWRASGDVDLLLSTDNLIKAKSFLEASSNSSSHTTAKNERRAHYEYYLDEWIVELHGTMHSELSGRIDKVVDEVQRDVFYGGNVRSWMNGTTTVFLPSPNNDAIFVFAHILQHLFLEGIGLRQICDWCRLLWTYRSEIDVKLLEQRLRKAGLMSEWKVFAALAVGWLGMPNEAMPLYSSDKKWRRKAKRIVEHILSTGNFGHNRDVEWSLPYKRRMMLIWHKLTDTIGLARVFPIDAPKFLMKYAWDGARDIVKG